jgi:pSer/pThr/pTyr-binding forkhead associated (FHA) protein/subtilisin family serine protease
VQTTDPIDETAPTPRPLEAESISQPSILERLVAHWKLLIALVAVGLVLVLVSGVLLWTSTGDGSSSSGAPEFTMPPTLEELAEQYPEFADLLTDPAIGSVYKDFLIAVQTGGIEAARDLADQRGLLNERDEIRITLVIDGRENVPGIVAELQGIGITVEGSYQERINVGVPLALIEQLAAQQGADALFERLTQTDHIIRLELPQTRRTDATERPQGEGVSLTGADAWHAAGYTGKSIRVGVLDLGFDGYRELLGSALPANVTAASFAYGVEPDQTGVDHGTACAEIIHQMAPDAELFLAYYDGSLVSQGMAVEWLLDQGVDIISNSTSGVVGPMDGSDTAAEQVDQVARQGVLWFNSAGNSAQEHYRGQFSDLDGNGFHEFPDGTESMGIAPYTPEIVVALNWDDWQNVTEDYDMYLFDSNGDLVASAEDIQDGSPGQGAAEIITLNGIPEGIYYVSIKAHNTRRPATFDLYTVGAEIEFPIAEHSVCSPADARGSLTVGATEYRDDSLAPYSSQGPTNDGRLKPEISAPAGVTNVTYGAFGFEGTSASTPHVAGAAALLLSAFPDRGREEIGALLESEALDLGTPGPDNGFGYGRLRLPAPPGGDSTVVEPTPAPPETEASLPTQVPEPTTVAVVPGPVVPSPPGESRNSAALLLLGAVGLCGATLFLGSGVLLVVALRRSSPGGSQAATYYPPPPVDREAAREAVARAPATLEGQQPLIPTPARDYGTLVGHGMKPIALASGTFAVGRESGNDIVLRSSQVSRRHARIHCARGVCTLEDLGSANGTRVNGERVDYAVLKPGDHVRLGDVELVYRTAETQRAGAWLELGSARHPVSPRGVTLGRSSDNDIHLSDSLVSRKHARIELQGGLFTIIDLDSANGTFVNGQRIRQHGLRSGDEIRVGHSQLRFRTPQEN